MTCYKPADAQISALINMLQQQWPSLNKEGQRKFGHFEGYYNFLTRQHWLRQSQRKKESSISPTRYQFFPFSILFSPALSVNLARSFGWPQPRDFAHCKPPEYPGPGTQPLWGQKEYGLKPLPLFEHRLPLSSGPFAGKDPIY